MASCVVAEGVVTDNFDFIYKVIRIEEVSNEGLRSAILCPLNAGVSHEHRMSRDDFNRLKKVPPLTG